MNRHEKTQVVDTVHGYYLPGPKDTDREAFTRAKTEAIAHFHIRLRNLKELDFETFAESKLQTKVAE